MASRVGKYLLFETLGEGAFGKVKLGVHEESGEQVAVKIMDKSDIKAQEMTMNVRREIAIMKALKHRNIVNLRQVLTSQSKLYIVMDLVTGGELFTKILNEGKLEESIARRYFQQLADGIEYCHRRGVCHRDLKPENLLIDETTGELKITDFGLSAMKGASTTEELLHTQCGSPNYCAPEIIARHKQGYNGTKVDAWSCGIILFALLAGFLPFYDENTKTLYRMIQRDDVKFPKRFPPDAKDLVLRLLHKEPEKRYTLAEVKKHPWFAVDYEGDDAVARSGPSPPSRRRRRTHNRSRSIDHGPRSRELAIAEAGHGNDSSQPKSLSSALPAAPPPMDTSRQIPSAHRPPPPPPVAQPPRSPAKGRPSSISTSPIPPLPPVPPPVPPSPLMQAPSSHPSSLHPGAGSTRPVPPYPGTTVVRRKSRDSRDSYPNDMGSVASGDSGNSAPISAGSNSIPAYPTISDAPATSHPPAPPSFPAPVQTQERSEGHTYPSSVPNGHSPKKASGTVPPPPSYGAPSRGHVPSLPPIPEAHPEKSRPSPVVLPSPPVIDGKAPIGKPGNVSPPRASKSKWTVPGPTPPPSYATAAIAPVTTPSALAHGDDSWQKHSDDSWQKTSAEEKKTEEPAAPALKEEERAENPKNTEEAKRPLSLVEQRRMMYSKHPEVPPPLPDTELSRVASSKLAEDTPPLGSKPISPLAQKFGDRQEMPRVAGYPSAGADDDMGGNESSVPSAGRNGEGRISAPLAVASAVEHVLSTAAMETDTPSDAPVPIERVIRPEMETAPNNAIAASHSPGITILEEDESLAVPLKKRLAAAVARYRRIFKLGNNIGITASPSFNSNKGSQMSLASADDENVKPGSDKSEFFARAKAVTGAWGIILTQEMDDESDSDEESPQVTELELEAFSRLLDFWDNRRASANISKGGEVILDDDEASPLSLDDIQSIQSLLQKLEPKQVEEEMEEVADVGLGSSDVGTEPTTPEVVYDTNEDVVRSGSGKKTITVEISNATTHALNGIGKDDITASASTQSAIEALQRSLVTASAAPPPPPPPPPRPPMDLISEQMRTPPPPPPPPPPPRTAKPNVVASAPWDRAVGVSNSAVPPPAPPMPAPPRPAPLSAVSPPPPPPPQYDPPVVATISPPRLAVTPSTVIDPFRPGAPPSYPPPRDSVTGAATSVDADIVDASLKRVEETNAAVERGGRLPQKPAREVERASQAKRASSVEAPDVGIQPKSVGATRESGRVNSAASGASNGSSSGNPQRRQVRSPSRDEHATRGMFGLGMFNRRKSSAATSFDSDLPPERCLLEIGRILATTMNCNVLMKRGESKMKCEVPLKQGKLLMISITCHQEKNLSTVQFKKGRKDRSHIDGKEFYEFFQKVRTLFVERVGAETRVHN